jgi:molybdopterin converting factor small subunit
MMKIKVSLYYHLKEKAGTGSLEIEVDDSSTINDLKHKLETNYPRLKTQLDYVMMLMNGKIVLNEDKLKDNANVSFLTPVGGG